MAKAAATNRRTAKPVEKPASIQIDWVGQTYEELIEGNLELSELTPSEVKKALNKSVGKYAFYSGMLADAKREQHRVDAEFELWQSKAYGEVDSKATKGITEAWKKIHVQLDNLEVWEAWKKKERRIEHIVAKLRVLVSSYEMQSRVLQTIGAMQRTEMERTTNIISSGDLSEDL